MIMNEYYTKGEREKNNAEYKRLKKKEKKECLKIWRIAGIILMFLLLVAITISTIMTIDLLYSSDITGDTEKIKDSLMQIEKALTDILTILAQNGCLIPPP